jgi:hypothetical protein
MRKPFQSPKKKKHETFLHLNLRKPFINMDPFNSYPGCKLDFQELIGRLILLICYLKRNYKMDLR